jgi:glycosyltransferase A (GT-A) superfamily protein (DUF2064 family)
MGSFKPVVFEGIEWSTESVFEQTLNRIEKAGSNVKHLQTLNDVDNIDDWKQVKGRL